LREVVQDLGPQEFMQLVRKVTKRQGNKPDDVLNKLLLAEWSSAVAKAPVNKKEFCERFEKAYRQKLPSARIASAGAIEKRLERLLKAQKRRVKRERAVKALLSRPSLVGEALKAPDGEFSRTKCSESEATE
jgi:hypothetical protein